MKDKLSKILLAVSGGIAAYKVCSLVSSLVKQGHEVRVVMSRQASRLVGPASFRALSGNLVMVDGEEPASHSAMDHIDLADWGDVLLIAPCTANIMGKLANGIADDLISTLAMASSGPVLLAPAMNPTMWNKASVRRNLATLVDDGYKIIGPETGRMACGHEGVGRMSEVDELERVIKEILNT